MINRIMHAMGYKNSSLDYVAICFDFLFPIGGIIHAGKKANRTEDQDITSLIEANNRYRYPGEDILIESIKLDIRSRNSIRNFYIFASSVSNTALLYWLTR